MSLYGQWVINIITIIRWKMVSVGNQKQPYTRGSMEQKENFFRCVPTLDMTIDIQGKDPDDAIQKMEELCQDIIDEACRKLSSLGFSEGGFNFPFVTDEWTEEENDDE